MEIEGDQNKVLIGSYTGGKDLNSVFQYDPLSKSADAVLKCSNPSYICCFENYIYIVSENEKGELIALNEKFQVLSRISTLGNSPCHISVNRDCSYLTVCNYNSGSVAMFTVANHKPTQVRCFMTHEGSSVNPERQSSPHPHCSIFSPCGNILFVTDLGTDVVYYYSLSLESIKAEKDKSIKMPGCGPRTICHAKDDKRLFLSCELDNTIRMLSYESDALQLVVAYRISSNPQNFPSEILYWQNQVYVALRGDDMILAFTDEKDKLAQRIGFKVGKGPRHFTITDYGVMYVSCLQANRVERYLMKGEKIYQISELEVNQPTVTAILPLSQ